MKEKLRALGDRWPWLGTALDVQERYGEVNGSAGAAAITLMAFLSLIPLVVVAIAVVGFVSAGGTNVTKGIVDKLSLTGDAAKQMRSAIDGAERSRRATSVVGFLGVLWSALGVTSALSHGIRLPWQEVPNGIKERLMGIVWGLGALVLFGLTMLVNVAVNYLPGWLPSVVSSVVLFVLGVATALALMLWTLWLLGNRKVPARQLVPGAVLAAVGYQVLTFVGAIYVPRLLQSSAVFGVLGVVVAILTWLLFFGKLIVYASTLNAVLYERHEGTVTLQIAAPRLAGEVPTTANRGGIVVERPAPKPDDRPRQDEPAGSAEAAPG